MKNAAKIIGRAFTVLAFFMVLCGLAYTLVITGAAQILFPAQANGSVVEVDGRTYGSALLGQSFTGTFTDADGKAVLYAWASNKSPAGAELEALVAGRVARLRAANPAMDETAIPVDLVTCSGSGLDPDISPAAAEYQVARVAAARGLSEDAVRAVVGRYTTGRFLGLFGEPRVNVLKVNLALDGILKEA